MNSFILMINNNHCFLFFRRFKTIIPRIRYKISNPGAFPELVFVLVTELGSEVEKVANDKEMSVKTVKNTLGYFTLDFLLFRL